MISRSILFALSISLTCSMHAGVRIEFDDQAGAAGATLAPVSVKISLPDSLTEAAKAGKLTLMEQPKGTAIHAQYEDGRLWWLMPAGKAGKRTFEVSAGTPNSKVISFKETDGKFICMDGDAKILCYNFKTVPVPPGVKGKYAVARSNYVHPIYGPSSEVLTKDFSKDYPHHRGLYWAWPEVMYKGQKRDLHALQGVFARPVKIVRKESGPVLACIEAENVWKWGDKEPIVREWATIRAFRSAGGNRVLDFTFRFEAIEPGVTVARRGTKAYGGINLRMSPRKDQKIRMTRDPQKSWAELVGVPLDGKTPIGVTILQHPANPRFPGDWQPYANLNWLQPTFPSKKERFELKVGTPLVLRCRLVVHPGSHGDARSAAMFTAYQSAE